MTPELTEDNFLLFAAKAYDRTAFTGIKEFHEDLGRIKSIKGLLKRYKNTGKLSDRLILNHIICLHNVFGDALVPILFFKTESGCWPQVKTFLVFLDYLEEGSRVLPTVLESDISLDSNIINILRRI
jgi:hypothetical protein